MTPVRLEPRPRGVLRYFHTYVGSGHFLGFKILNFIILGRFSEFFFFLWGGGGGVYEDFVDILCGVITNWTIFSGYFNAF